MNKIRKSLCVTEIDTLSDALVRLYQDAAKDEAGAVAKDAALASMMAEVERLSADITTAIKSDRRKTQRSREFFGGNAQMKIENFMEEIV